MNATEPSKLWAHLGINIVTGCVVSAVVVIVLTLTVVGFLTAVAMQNKAAINRLEKQRQQQQKVVVPKVEAK